MEKPFAATGFDWDASNVEKNWKKHRVQFAECEEIFSDPHLLILPDKAHSQIEDRYLALGTTKGNRPLFAAFTERKGKIRVVSARPMSRKERKAYHEEIKKNASSKN